MAASETLETYLSAFAGNDPLRLSVARAVIGMAGAGRVLGAMVADGGISAEHGSVIGENFGGDAQKALDLKAHEVVLDAMRLAGVAMLGSEEADHPDQLDPNGLVAVAIDPLDGSSNIDINISIGTIFSVLPRGEEENPFLQKGIKQLAAGYIVYGPHTDLVLTVGEGTAIFTLDRWSGRFLLTERQARIADVAKEFAVNVSNYRHWAPEVRRYVDDCLAGQTGPRQRDFNMRWVASLVAEVSRILARGGVFLYPEDNRPGYRQGRLRLVYEANPIAFVVEQAGGKASNGRERILEIAPTDLHEKTALVLGSTDEVGRFEYYRANSSPADRNPLFNKRGLFRDE
jgi:fructose-1,6-bisphosphatase I